MIILHLENGLLRRPKGLLAMTQYFNCCLSPADWGLPKKKGGGSTKIFTFGAKVMDFLKQIRRMANVGAWGERKRLTFDFFSIIIK